MTLPEVPARPWVGPKEAAGTGARVLARALGARDVALGFGAIEADLSGRDLRPWLIAGAKADALDAVITVSNWRRLPSRGRIAVLTAAGGSALVGLWAASAMASEGGARR